MSDNGPEWKDDRERQLNGAGLMGCGGLLVVASGGCSAALVFNNGYLDVPLVEAFGWIPVVVGIVFFLVGLRRYWRR